MSRTIAIDFETMYKSGEYDIKSLGAFAYVRDARFDPYLISVSDGKETWAGHPKDFCWSALEGATLLSHNRAFDEFVYLTMVERNLADKVNYQSWHDTAALSTYLCGRRDLARASEFLLGSVVDKSYRIDADGKSWDDMVKDGVAEKVKEAGRIDALRCWQIWSKYQHLWPDSEKRLSDLTVRQGRKGAQIDEALLKKYLVVAQTMLIQAEQNLPWMKEGKKPTSPKAIAEECRKHGIAMPPVKSRDGEDAYEAWAAAHGPKFKWVKAFTDYRVLNKFIGTLETIRDRLTPEGIFNYDLLYFGAIPTGRWAGGGGYNMQNMRKAPLYCDDAGWLITDEGRLKEIEKSKELPGYVAHVLDIRALFIARRGKKLIISDLAQIEARALCWLAGDTAMLELMKPTPTHPRGISPYESHARTTMSYAGGDLKNEDKDLYALAKARVLGLGFGCGWRKFIIVAQVIASLDITKDDPEFIAALDEDGQPMNNLDGTPKMVSGYGMNSQRIVREYRESNPLIVNLWKKFDEAFRDSVGSDFVTTLPSGRQMRYPDVRRERKMVQDLDKPGKFVFKWGYTAAAFNAMRGGAVRENYYGALLVQNATQATARDAFSESLLTLDSTSGIDVLWSEHDAAVNEVDEHVTKEDVERIMSRTPDWLPGCPIAAEAVESKCYLK